MVESQKDPVGPRKRGPERRRARRRPTNMQLKYRRLDERNIPVELEYRSGRVLDISPGGMCAELELALPLGQNVEIATDEGNGEKPVRALGTVVRIVRRTDYFEVGITFQKHN